MIKANHPFFRLYLLFLFILLSLASCEAPREVSPWDCIDSNSVLIIESDHVPMLPDQIFISFFLKKADLYLSSVQKSSKDDFEILYSYLLERELYDSLLNYRSNIKNQKIVSRLFNGVEIQEIKGDSNEIQLSLTYLGGIFALSKSSVLIENAIRTFQNKDKKNFKVNNEELFQFPSLKSDQGNLYLNINTRDVFSFFGLSSFKSISLLNELENLSFYDVRSSKQFLSLNGFSTGRNSGLVLFQKQKPVNIKVTRFIPNYSNALVHFGITDFDSFKGQVDSLFVKRNSIANEIAFISNPISGKSLIALIELATSVKQDFTFITDYNEVYSNYEIRGVNGDALKIGFGKLFPSDSFRFSTIKDGYLLLASSLEELKSLIDAIENDDTWSKTIEYQKFIERGLQESNVTLILKNPSLFAGNDRVLKGYSALIDSLGLARIDWCSIQMSALDNHFYSNINFSLGSAGSKTTKRTQETTSSLISFNGDIHVSSLVKNHITGLQELLVQDSDFMVYLVSLSEGVLWKRQIDGPIQRSIDQLDYYKNGKLQYFFSANNKLYIIDRLGRDVAGFPKVISSNLQFSQLVDYDKSKNYRLLISTSDREISLLDKEGKNISEWGPKKFDKNIARSPEHIKVGGKDFFILHFEEGTVLVFNRKGDQVNTFKTMGKKVFSGDYHLESGLSSSSSYLNYVSNDGVFTKQNLEGKILSSENLLRGKNSQFILRRIFNSDGFYIYRVDTDKIAIMDNKGNVILEKQNSGSVNLEIQGFKIGSSNIIFCVFDVDQRLAQVFDQSGNALIQAPIESDMPPLFGFIKSKNEFGMFSFPQRSVVFNTIQ